MPPDALTAKERLCLSLLADFWNAYLELSELHPADRSGACANVHDLQNRVLARRAQREQAAPEVPPDVANLLRDLEWVSELGSINTDLRCPCCKATSISLEHQKGCKLAEVLGRLP